MDHGRDGSYSMNCMKKPMNTKSRENVETRYTLAMPNHQEKLPKAFRQGPELMQSNEIIMYTPLYAHVF